MSVGSAFLPSIETVEKAVIALLISPIFPANQVDRTQGLRNLMGDQGIQRPFAIFIETFFLELTHSVSKPLPHN